MWYVQGQGSVEPFGFQCVIVPFKNMGMIRRHCLPNSVLTDSMEEAVICFAQGVKLYPILVIT